MSAMMLHLLQPGSALNYQYLRPFLFPLIFVFVIAANWLFSAVKGGLFKREFRLRKQGLELQLAGRPAEAEACYRRALALGAKLSEDDRTRLEVCSADSLIDLGRYNEAQEYLDSALKRGDSTGSGQGSVADLLLLQKRDPEKAIEMAERALDLNLQNYEKSHQGLPDNYHQLMVLLRQAVCWSRKAEALALLNRQGEARQSIDRATRILDDVVADKSSIYLDSVSLVTLLYGRTLTKLKNLQLADLGLKIGDALLAMADREGAARYFRIALIRDPKGKYRRLAKAQLEKLGCSS